MATFLAYDERILSIQGLPDLHFIYQVFVEPAVVATDEATGQIGQVAEDQIAAVAQIEPGGFGTDEAVENVALLFGPGLGLPLHGK